MDQLDLKLWADKSLVQRQNQLKSRFWTLFGELGDLFSDENLAQIQTDHKGKKLSKGNDLLGFPYHVLDLVRDFDEKKGCNIRLLNWFGHGIFLFVYLSPFKDAEGFQKDGSFQLSSTENIFDYAGMILEKKSKAFKSLSKISSNGFSVLFKRLEIDEDQSVTLAHLEKEIKKVIKILKSGVV